MFLYRYYAILYPMRAKYMFTVRRARSAIGGVWCLALFLAIPIIFGQVSKSFIFTSMMKFDCDQAAP